MMRKLAKFATNIYLILAVVSTYVYVKYDAGSEKEIYSIIGVSMMALCIEGFGIYVEEKEGSC